MYRAMNSSLWGKITILLIICCCCLSAQAKYGVGTGEPNDPYLIFTAEQMNEIGLSVNSDDLDKHFKLMADIDLSGFTGTAFNIIGNNITKFTGVFDGNSHTISKFSYDSIDTDYIGIFGVVRGEDAEIKNLGLIDPNVDAGIGSRVGSLVGYLRRYGTITNCYVKGGSVTGDESVGGLVGKNSGTITNCYATGSVTGNRDVGGLVGYNGGTITNCFSTCSVTGTNNVGGLVGDRNSPGGTSASYWDIETSGQTTSAGGTGKTTAQMQTASTFIGWAGCGNEGIWTIDEGNDYPRLWWENMPGESITPPSYGGGNGEPNDPYLIYTAEQLNTIGLLVCDWDKHFRLMADIDLSSFTGTSFNIIGYWINYPDNKAFTGVFDGNGHMISNFTYTSTGTSSVGLFGYVGWGAEIKNLGLIDPNVEAKSPIFFNSYMVGSLVGYLGNGTITDCYVEGGSVYGGDSVGGLVGSVGGGYDDDGTMTNCYANCSVSGFVEIGGLVGYNSGKISNCYAEGDVSGNENVGGLVGENVAYEIYPWPMPYWQSIGEISNCYSTGSVSGNENVGGLVGSNMGYCIWPWPSPPYCLLGKISNCYSTGSVTGINSVGGLVGDNSGRITNCYSTGSTSGSEFVGGLVGLNDFDGRITNCDSSGDVSGWLYVGGLAGLNSGAITNCYSIASVEGVGKVGGLVGDNELCELICDEFGCQEECYYGHTNDSFWDTETSGQASSDGGTGLPTAEMQMQVTFTDVGWDFNTPVWTIDEGLDYPRLWWEYVPILHAEPEVTLGTSNTIFWDPVVGDVEYYAECAEDADFTSIIYNTGWITETSCEFTGLEQGQQYWYSVKARNSTGIETAWSNVEFSLQCTLADAVHMTLEPESLKNKNAKNALLNKIDAALKMIDQANYTGALSKLRNDILQKTNGCAETDQPDKNDWILTCEQQSEIYPLIIETIEHVKGLMGE